MAALFDYCGAMSFLAAVRIARVFVCVFNVSE